ncbi:MAPEG family protein [Paucibacter sp. PLA-PC-4]|uniref:MAPEG family protein n=1 Tax=Paucibacter sp. PLA-PC-4 TaxID=2993655 RepID=UPI002248C441|nr:MAPEG family protein [Paucibacter sp. PLA-PC-4]MCX2862728.1 MAPEG family protein [Paucibacter sp. PLA-PC-4]
MTVANYCIIAACVLPILCAGMAKSKGFGRPRRDGGFDNHNPRAWLASLSGWQARANAAQANSFEALPLFIAGVLAAQQMGAVQERIDMLALSFITFRLAYIGLYLADQPNLRSLAWFAALGSAVALFFA